MKVMQFNINIIFKKYLVRVMSDFVWEGGGGEEVEYVLWFGEGFVRCKLK